MNLSFTDIIKYWDVITQYFNPFPIILWGAVGFIIGMLVMIVIQLILRKKILMKRRHWTLKALAYAYMFLLPLWAGYSVMQWSALHACERQIVRNIPTYLGDANSLFNVYLKDYATQVISERHLALTGNEIIDASMGAASGLIASTLESFSSEEDDLKGQISSYVIVKMAESNFFKDLLVDKIEGHIGTALLMDKDLTRDLLNVKISAMMDDGILNTILEKHVGELFGSFKMSVLITFLLVLLIPAIEIGIAHYMHRNQLPPPVPPGVP